MMLALEKTIGFIVAFMAFELASRTALHLSIVATVLNHTPR